MSTTTITMDIPSIDTYFKSYMDHRTITDETSPQWALQHSPHTYTDDKGCRRIEDDYFVALTTYYGSCGDRLRFTLDTDKEFTVMIGEIKNPDQTDKNNMYHPVINKDGELICANVIEFIVDTDVLDERVKTVTGDISDLGFEGNIVKIEKFIIDK